MAAKGQSQEPSIPRLFTELQLAGDDGEFETGLKIAEKILSLAPEDRDALHCKVVCLLQLSKFQEAVKLIDASSKKAGEKQFRFEKAYCLYRLEKYADSHHLLDSLLHKQPQTEPRVQELLAQVTYRLGRYGESKATYASIVKEYSDDFDTEREANFAAALSLGNEPDDASFLASLRTGSMEQCFNLACCYLALGREEEAESALRQSEELYRKTLQEEDYTEEEMESELAVVRVQLGYALQLQDKGREAMGLYNAVLKQKPSDVSHSVVASNNIIVLNRDRDIFDSKKKAKVLANEGSSKKLTRSQKLSIVYNRCLFALQTNQLEQCRQLVARLKEARQESHLAVLAEVALLNREKKTAACTELLEAHLQAQPFSEILLYATLAQLHLSQGNTSRACAVLHSIPDLPRHLGVVSSLVSLHTSLGAIDAASETLDEAVAWWLKQQRSGPAQQVYLSLSMHSARYKLQRRRYEAAAGVLEQLRSESPSDLLVLAMLISCYSRFDSGQAEELSRTLPTLQGLSPAAVDALEQMPSFRHTRRQLQKPEENVPEKKELLSRDKKRKRKRKPRLPKNYDPATEADPERWLPLRERTYYRKGRKKGFSALRGTQGATSASAALTAQLDASKPKSTSHEATGRCPHSIPGLYDSEVRKILESKILLTCYPPPPPPPPLPRCWQR